ncbi:ABC transporter permease [Rhodohalobacter sp. 614A]|uniref:ABC transporter permease n=1 Tax=Rhodohalobacter sp. 614A TaxID=2908649 RepID=UPI001F3F7E0A|nr:ABC transporter permease [Rhodohalobacter sp. 614A]
MRTIQFILQKEFLQIFRNKAMLPILFAMPIVQLLVLSFAATYELKEASFALVDYDQSSLSRELTAQLQATGYFRLEYKTFSEKDALSKLQSGDVNMILTIPKDFDSDFLSGKPAPVQMLIDAVDGTKAGMIQSYSSSIIRDFNENHVQEVQLISSDVLQPPAQIELISINWYNPDLDYITYMVPGILVVLVSMIGLFLSGMNIVREQEIGTIEQLNVTPIKKSHFITGKIIPFWIIGMVDLLIGLGLARYGFNIPFLGSLLLILFVSGVYLIVIQALGLFISTVTSTQQQAMFIAWFIMVVFILMGGLFTPIESMPVWAQELTLANPVAWFIKMMRMVLLKGAGWQEISHMVIILVGMGILFYTIALNRYKKTSG